jgi:hypothetical protein
MNRCYVCREQIRPEDTFTADNHGRLVHIDCYEGEDGN